MAYNETPTTKGHVMFRIINYVSTTAHDTKEYVRYHKDQATFVTLYAAVVAAGVTYTSIKFKDV